MIRNLLVVLVAVCTPTSGAMAQSAHPEADEALVREIHAGFDEMDRDHNGKASRIEMTSYGHSKGIRGMINSKVWRQMDVDRNGWISKDEFTNQMLKYERERKPQR